MSLRFKFALIALGIQLFFIVAIFALIEIDANQKSLRNLDALLADILAVHRASLAGPLWTLDERQVELEVQSIAIRPDIAHVSVTDQFGRVIAQSNPHGDNAAIAFTETVGVYRNEGGAQRLIGELTVSLTPASLAVERTNRLLIAAPLALLLLVGVALGNLYAFRRTVDQPLSRLLAAINRQHSSRGPVHVEWRSNDEMEVLATAFNNMISAQAEHERALVAARDELERRVDLRAQELLLVSEHLTEAIESIDDGFALFSPNLSCLRCNNRFVEIVKQFVPASQFVSDEDFTAWLNHARYHSLIRDARSAKQIEVMVDEHDGAKGTDIVVDGDIVAETYLLSTAQGEIYRVSEHATQDGGFVCIYNDVTELHRARVAAEKGSRAKSAFLANMSHEIRTPINGIVGLLEVLEYTPLDDDQRQIVGKISDSSESLLNVIADILDISKIESGFIQIERDEFKIRYAIEAAFDIVSARAAEKRLDLALVIAPDVPRSVVSDPARLRQILINLLGNAVKFTDKGSIVVRVDMVRRGEEPRIRFAVTDTGRGIDPADIQHLFRPFEQGAANHQEATSGTGLGLSISQELVQLLGGHISVDSRVGEGSTFAFELPVGTASHAALRSEGGFDFRGLEAGLVVESEPVYEMLASIIVSAGGHPRRVYAPDGSTTTDGEYVDVIDKVDILVIDLPKGEVEGHTSKDQHNQRQGSIVVSAARERDGAGPSRSRERVLHRPPHRSDLLRAIAEVTGRRVGDSPVVDDDTVIVPPASPDPTTAERQGQLVLVVEDNPTNLEVTRKQLSILGYASDAARDGGEGLRKWQEGKYGLILSDGRMPVMDGLEMTRAIRTHERETGRPATPVVALTANVLAGEAERCARAGMNDYLGKPTRMEDLRTVLHRWLGPPGAAQKRQRLQTTLGDGLADAKRSPSTQRDMPRRKAKASPFNLAKLEATLGSVDVTLLSTLLDHARPELTDLPFQLRQALNAGDLKSVAAISHRAVGTAGAIAATNLVDVLRQIELTAEREETIGLAEAVTRVAQDVDDVLNAELPVERTEKAV